MMVLSNYFHRGQKVTRVTITSVETIIPLPQLPLLLGGHTSPSPVNAERRERATARGGGRRVGLGVYVLEKDPPHAHKYHYAAPSGDT